MEAGALISELKRRRVFCALVGYGIGCIILPIGARDGATLEHLRTATD